MKAYDHTRVSGRTQVSDRTHVNNTKNPFSLQHTLDLQSILIKISFTEYVYEIPTQWNNQFYEQMRTLKDD